LLYDEKLASELMKRGSRVLHQLLNKIMQKISVKQPKRSPTASLEKGGPEETASFVNT